MEQWDKREEKGHGPKPRGLSQIPSSKVACVQHSGCSTQEKLKGAGLEISRQLKRLLGEFRAEVCLPLRDKKKAK